MTNYQYLYEICINIKSEWIYYIDISSNSNLVIYKVKTAGIKRTGIFLVLLDVEWGAYMGIKTMIVKDNLLFRWNYQD